MAWKPSDRFRSIVEQMVDDEEFRSGILRDPKAAVLYHVGPLNDDEQLLLVHLAETWSDSPDTLAELAVIRQSWAANTGGQPIEG
jgi:hypothetical protein